MRFAFVPIVILAAFVGLLIMSVGCTDVGNFRAAFLPPLTPHPNVHITVAGVCVAVHAGNVPGRKYVVGPPYTLSGELEMPGEGDQPFVLLPEQFAQGALISVNQGFRQEYIADPGNFECTFWTSIYQRDGQLLRKGNCSTANSNQSCTVHVEASYP
jgi:hypothetical protein